MIEILKRLWEPFRSFLPAGLVFEGGSAAVLAILALFVLLLFWQAVTKNITDALAAWLKRHSVGVLAFLLGLPILASAAAGRTVTAVALAVLACLVGWLRWRGRLRLSLVPLSVVLLLALGLSLAAEEAFRARAKERETIYVVLALQPTRGEDMNTLLSLSNTLRDIIGRIFVDVPNVKIEPAGFTAIEDLVDWKEPESARRLLRTLEPDLFLQNSASLLSPVGSVPGSGEPAYTYIRLVMTPRHGADKLRRILVDGRQEDFPYLVLRATLELLVEVGRLPGQPLSKEVQWTVMQNLLKAYRDALADDMLCPGEDQAAADICVDTRELLEKPSVTESEVAALIDRYPPDHSRHQRELADQLKRAAGIHIFAPPTGGETLEVREETQEETSAVEDGSATDLQGEG